MNKYLREELAQGKLGVGYIMSQLKYEQGYIARLVRSVFPAAITNRLKRRVEKS